MFNLRSYNLIKDYSFGTERSTGIKDYHLKGCMVDHKCKINVSGRKRWKSGLQVPPTKCGDRVVAKVDDLRLEERVTRLCGGG